MKEERTLFPSFSSQRQSMASHILRNSIFNYMRFMAAGLRGVCDDKDATSVLAHRRFYLYKV